MHPATRLNQDPESRALTGLRGIGALLVVLHHVHLHLGTGVPAAWDGLLRRGYMGVDLFFVLSGFVISLAYGPWFDGTQPGRVRSVPTFLVRRIARLWPLHVAMLAVILLLGGYTPNQAFSPRSVLANVAMTQAWGFSRSLNPPDWSVSTEFLAYLLFPAIAAPLLQGRLGVILGALGATLLLAICLRYSPPFSPARRGWLDIYQNYSPLPVCRCLAGFVVGMLAWRVGQHPAASRLFRNGWTGPVALLAVLLMLQGGANDLVIYPLLPLVVLGLHFGAGPAVRAFAQGPVHRLGVLSYAIYLIHFTLLYRFPFGAAPFWIMLPAYLLATLAGATLAHSALEVPGRRLIRRLGAAVLATPRQPPVLGPPLHPPPP